MEYSGPWEELRGIYQFLQGVSEMPTVFQALNWKENKASENSWSSRGYQLTK